MTVFKKFVKKYFSPSEEIGARVNNFNVIRMIAAAMVIYGHMAHIMGLPVHTIYGQAVSSIAVKMLFILSGYLIMKSLINDSHFGRYMLRRSFRIFPGLIGVVLFAVFIVGPVATSLSLKEYFLSYGTWVYLRNIVLYPIYSLPGVFGNYTYPNAVNGSLWTLPVEFSLYLVLPALLVVFKKLRIVKWGLFVTTVVCIVGGYLRLKFPEVRFVFYGSNLPDALAILPYFFAGSFLALPEFKKYFNLQIAVFLMFVTAIFRFSSTKYEILLCVILPYAVLSFALTERPVFSKWFAKSDFTYGLYLYGFVIQQLVHHQLAKLNSSVFSLNITFAICFVLTFVCAVISWYLIEKPMQILCKKILNMSYKK